MKNPHYKPSVNGSGEAEVVLAEPLGDYLRRWNVRYLQEHPLPQQNAQNNFNGDDERHPVAHFGPVQYLAFHSGINLTVVGKICNSHFPHVSFSKADALLTVIDLSHLLGDEIPVIPNPHWTLKKWIDYMESRGCI